jgi:dTDP-4-dehydrorhamnose reductase
MNLLLLGKDGQVGRQLSHALPSGEPCVCLGRNELDLGNLDALEGALRQHKPQVIVNAAAYTAVDKAEGDEAAARLVNADAVAVMAAFAARTRGLLVHYSTDYVFDGEQRAPYVESDRANPQSAYGRTKFAGEQAIVASGCDALVFRTSWVYSVYGGNFVKTILRLAKEREALEVVADQHGAPTGADLIAHVTVRALASRQAGKFRDGLYHLAASGETTWHEIACEIVTRARSAGAPLKLDPGAIRPIPSEAYPSVAKRPRNSRLATGLLSSELGLELPHWKIGVHAVVDRLCEEGL